MSPFLNNSSNSFFVQEIFLYFIIPFILFSVSISKLNFLTFFTIASFQSSDFSILNFFKSLFQSLLYFLFVTGPLHPFLLSYSSRPFRNDSVAIDCSSRLIGVFIINPCL